MSTLYPDTQRAREDVEKALQKGRRVYVEGSTGSGRSTLANALGATGAVVVELLDLRQTDAAAAALLQLVAGVGVADRPRPHRGNDHELFDLASSASERIHGSGRTIVVRLPASWGDLTTRSTDSKDTLGHARAWFEGLIAGPAPTVVIADAGLNYKDLGLHGWEVIRLGAHEVPASSLEAVDWGACRDAFTALASSTGPGLRASPLAWRLGVGIVALGGDVRQAREWIGRAPALPRLTRELGTLAARDEALTRSLQAALALRRSVDASTFLSITAPPAGRAELLTQCVGYGSQVVRMASAVREGLAASIAKPTDAQTHYEIAARYRALDGASSPWTLESGDQVSAWNEKVHHLARSGDLGAEEWGRQDLAAPQHYWERAVALSMQSRYVEAAAIYERCVAEFPDDDYGWHYLAWNSQRARGPRAVVEHGYRQAVSLSVENPWWNSRLVSFLIEDGQPGQAREEWARAVARVDADGEDLSRSPWLAEHMYYWVAKAWLRSGRAVAAADVLEAVPQTYKARVRHLRWLTRLVQEADPRRGGEDPRWARFLESAAHVCSISEAHAEHVRATWTKLREFGGPSLPLPAAAPTSDGERVQFCWSYAAVLLEIEVDEHGAMTWFGRDRRTAEFQSSDEMPGDDHLRLWLSQVTNA